MDIRIFIDTAFAIALALIGYLARRGDGAQQKVIESLQAQADDLYEKHEKDTAKLQELEVKVAERYHSKDEINSRFERLEHHISEEFKAFREDLRKILEVRK